MALWAGGPCCRPACCDVSGTYETPHPLPLARAAIARRLTAENWPVNVWVARGLPLLEVQSNNTRKNNAHLSLGTALGSTDL